MIGKHVVLWLTSLCTAVTSAFAGQAPGSSSAANVPISGKDRIYLSDQFSNTISVVNPATNMLLGVIKLGDTTPANLSPLYRGQLLVHGMGYAPDHKTLAVVSIGSNSVTFIDTATNAVKHVSYVGRSPHEAMFTQDGSEVWVTVRGEDYVQVLDGTTFAAKLRITVPNGPGMTIFSPDGTFGYVCSSFTPDTVAIDTHAHEIVGHIAQPSPFCPDIAAAPDGRQVWQTLKDVGKVQVFDARPPFKVMAILDTGPITNHVNFVNTPKGQFAYVTVGGLNVVKVFTTDATPKLVATIPTGDLPHGLWPSGDGSRIAVGLENANAVAIIDTATHRVLSTIASGQAPQGMAYIPDAVPEGEGTSNLQALSSANDAVHLTLGAPGSKEPSTTVTLNNQGLVDIVQAAVTGLPAKKTFVLAISTKSDGSGELTPIVRFTTNPAGAAIVDAISPLRKAIGSDAGDARRYLVIAQDNDGSLGAVLQVSREATRSGQ